MATTLVGATVVERAGDILLVREGKPPVADTWNLPGGRMEAGEGPLACARREAKEETGLEVRPQSLIGLYLDTTRVVETDVLVFVFRSRSGPGEPRPSSSDSVLEVRWVTPAALDEFDLRERYVRAAIEDAVAGVSSPLELLNDLRR